MNFFLALEAFQFLAKKLAEVQALSPQDYTPEYPEQPEPPEPMTGTFTGTIALQ